MVLSMHERAVQFATKMNSIKGFYIDNNVVFNQVIVRYDTNEITENALKNVQ